MTIKCIKKKNNKFILSNLFQQQRKVNIYILVIYFRNKIIIKGTARRIPSHVYNNKKKNTEIHLTPKFRKSKIFIQKNRLKFKHQSCRRVAMSDRSININTYYRHDTNISINCQML